MRTEDQFYNDHLAIIEGILLKRADEIENQTDLDAQDEMELSALDRLVTDLYRLY